jgi:hypothetical protein
MPRSEVVIIDGRSGVHGTRRRYRAGCRCAACHECNAEHHRAARERRALRLEHDAMVIVHGLGGYCNHGCRCDVCLAAKSRHNAARYTRP